MSCVDISRHLCGFHILHYKLRNGLPLPQGCGFLSQHGGGVRQWRWKGWLLTPAASGLWRAQWSASLPPPIPATVFRKDEVELLVIEEVSERKLAFIFWKFYSMGECSKERVLAESSKLALYDCDYLQTFGLQGRT